MNRRSKDVEGWVEFPVNSPAFLSSQEGGMLVKLVVCDDSEQGVGMCCGAYACDVLSETLSGDDATDEHSAALDNHYPMLSALYNSQRTGEVGDYLSRQYKACIVMGSTGWSGWNGNEYWKCTYHDLTDDGRRLYDMLLMLYPTCKLHLLTFLDT